MSSSGKRKRGVPSHQLIQVAECGMRAELSCMHALVDTPEGACKEQGQSIQTCIA